jgi:hypothetical protein
MLMGIQFGSAERAPQENNALKIIRFVAPAAYNNAIVFIIFTYRAYRAFTSYRLKGSMLVTGDVLLISARS